MIPMWLKLKIPRKASKPTTLWLPLFLVWPLVLILFILLIPIWLIGITIAYTRGYGQYVLRLPTLLISTFWYLKGLTLNIRSRDEFIYFEFI